MTVQPPSDVPKAAPSNMKYILASVIVLIGIAVIGAIVINTLNEDDDEGTDTQSEAVDEGQAEENESGGDNVDVDSTDSTPCAYDDASCFSTWFGLEQGVTEDGIPKIGSDNAPIIIGEFGDFGCPHCLAFAPSFEALVTDYAAAGQAQFYYFPLAFVRGENSVIAAQMAICSIEQGAFWQVHEVLFDIQETQTFEAFTLENLVRVAGEMGLDSAGMGACMLSEQPNSVLAAAQSAGDAAGVTGTPTIVYSMDGGETWTVLEDRSEANIRAVIESAN